VKVSSWSDTKNAILQLRQLLTFTPFDNSRLSLWFIEDVLTNRKNTSVILGCFFVGMTLNHQCIFWHCILRFFAQNTFLRYCILRHSKNLTSMCQSVALWLKIGLGGVRPTLNLWHLFYTK